MRRWTTFSLVLSALFAAPFLAACGDDAAATVPGGDQTAFFPEGIEYVDVAPYDTRGLKVLAATITEVEQRQAWLVAVKNEGVTLEGGAAFVCSAEVRVAFFDANMFDVGSTVAKISAPMHRTDTGSVQLCLGTGEVGVGVGVFSAPPSAQFPIRHVSYRLAGGLYDGATILSEVALDKVAIADASAATTSVTGAVVNRGSTAAQWPTAYLYPLNSAGRPFSVGLARGTESIAPGASWNFGMTVKGPVNRYAAFAQTFP